ncbi:hypothetical protein H4R20_001595 [Coemansia guatemalensis]|uniref:RRM domain-containing protein n=1 Tax=Coemansia guatemalensis TaxID=2761395 RepID=A0A9W8HX46_9FUNG|nr:hypothetical protein H4R20_001595 [Coemansia guatemalensis]
MEYRVEAPPSHIVFIGNVGYGTTEEQLRQMLELAGPVVDIQLVFDPVTNRAKGFGFCEYADRNIAASAIKNLNDTLVDGRNIKIGYADRGRVRRYLGTDGTTLRGGRGGTLLTRSNVVETNAPVVPQPKSIGVDQVMSVMETLDNRQKANLVGQFRAFACVNMAKARDELDKNPGLAHALLIALESLDAIDMDTLARIKTARANVPMVESPYHPDIGEIPDPRRQPHVQNSAPSQYGFQPAPLHGVQVTPSPSAPPAGAAADMDNNDLLKQLLSLTDAQLSQLPEDHRNQILELRKRLYEG